MRSRHESIAVRHGLVVHALAAFAAATLSAATVRAASINDFSLGPELGGPQKGTFGPNVVVHFSGKNRFINVCREKDGINDFVYPAGDVYVVTGASSPGAGAMLKDAGGAPSTVIDTVSAGFQDEILTITAPGGKLGAGTYSVVFDTCQDGKFTPSEDDFWPDAITVELPAVLPPIAPYIADVKSAALTESDHWQKTANAFHRMLAAGAYIEGSACFRGDKQACLGLIQTIAEDPAVEDYLSDVGKLAKATACQADLSACIGLIGDLLGTPPAISSSPRDVVLGGFKNLLANEVKSYFSVYLDPPRDDFALVASPTVPWVFAYEPGGSRFLAAVATANPAVERHQALLQAFLTALERYQGAERAGYAPEALARLEEARGLAALLSAGLPQAITRLQDIGPALLLDAPDVEAAFQLAAASHARVASHGFSPEDLRALRNMGLSQTQIDAVYARELSYSSSDLYNPSVAEWNTTIAVLAQSADGTSAAFDDAAAQLGELAEQIRSDYPAADDAVALISIDAPATGTVGTPLSLTANAPDGFTLEWDLQALGKFEDGTGSSVEVTYRLPGERAVSVRASAPGKVAVATTALVTIVDDNSPPTITSALPEPRAVWVQAGEELDFSVAATDPDGDPVGVSWHLDGAEVASGVGWKRVFTANELGQHRVQAIVSDGRRGHDATSDFAVMVRAVDVDGDGWSDTAAGDCNDSDPSINPGLAERLLNGKDDDCDAATLDAPPAVEGGDVNGGRVSAWGTDLSSLASDYGPEPVVGLNDARQVELGLAYGWALRADSSVTYFSRSGGPCPVSGTDNTSCLPGLLDVAGVGGAPRLTGVTAIDYDDYQEAAAALRQDGSVVAWGANGNGGLGTGSSASVVLRPAPVVRADNQQPLNGLRALEVGTFNNWGLLPNGDVWAWGARGGNICLGPDAYATVPTALAFPAPIVGKATQISDHLQRAIFLRPDGTVATCDIGDSNPAMLPKPIPSFGERTPFGRAVQVLTSNAAFWVVTERGELYGWGQQVGGGFSVFGIPTGPTPVPPFSDKNGTFIAAPTLAPLPAGAPVLWISGEGDTFHVVRADGSVVIWGGTTHYANGSATNASIVPPATLSVGSGFPLSSDASAWSGGMVVVPSASIAPEWTPPKQWTSVLAGPAEGESSGDEESELNVPIRLTYAVDVPVTVQWVFDGKNGSTLIPAGATSANALVSLPRDGIDGPPRSLELAILSVDAGARIERRATAVAVLNIDPPPSVTLTPATFKEGNSSLTDLPLTLTLSQPSAWETRVRLVTQDGSALQDVDYRSADLVVPFAPGELTRVVHLAGIGDTVVEPDRELTVQISGETHLDAGPVDAAITLRDDDPVPLEVSATSVAAGETASLNVSAPELLAGEAVEVDFETVDGSAISGADFVGTTGKLRLTSDEGATISVATSPNAGADAPEPGMLQLYVRLRQRSGERTVLPPPLVAVGITVEATGQGGAPSTGNGDGGTPSPGGGVNEGGDGGDPSDDTYAVRRQDGGCGCSFQEQSSPRVFTGWGLLLLALVAFVTRARQPRTDR